MGQTTIHVYDLVFSNKQCTVLKKWAILGIFFIFSKQLTVNVQYKFCWWLDLIRRPLVLEATVLQIESQQCTFCNNIEIESTSIRAGSDSQSLDFAAPSLTTKLGVNAINKFNSRIAALKWSTVDLNCGPLESEATALPTELPQPLPWKVFLTIKPIHRPEILLNHQTEMTSSHGAKSKPLLVFVNPTSGTKLAKTMLQQILKPELDKRDVEFELVRFLRFSSGDKIQRIKKIEASVEEASKLVQIIWDDLSRLIFRL